MSPFTGLVTDNKDRKRPDQTPLPGQGERNHALPLPLHPQPSQYSWHIEVYLNLMQTTCSPSAFGQCEEMLQQILTCRNRLISTFTSGVCRACVKQELNLTGPLSGFIHRSKHTSALCCKNTHAPFWVKISTVKVLVSN